MTDDSQNVAGDWHTGYATSCLDACFRMVTHWHLLWTGIDCSWLASAAVSDGFTALPKLTGSAHFAIGACHGYLW